MELSLKAMRVNKNITQEQAAEYIDVSVKQFREKESGRTALWLSEAVKLSELYCQPIEAICALVKEN